MALESDFREGPETGLASPLGVFDELLSCFEVDMTLGVDFGGSGALLERMLENAIGSFVLVVFGVSAG